jgi:AcrR family transcriptional regulator
VARTVGSAADQTRLRILQTASDLFVEHGYAGTSIRDISERLGMTKGSLYYHFSSKEDLLQALIAPLFTAVDDFVTAARAFGRVTPDLVRRLVEVLDEHGPMLRSFLGDPSLERAKVQRQRMPARFFELQEILGGGLDGPAMLRARCALGVIHAGVLAPRVEDCTPDGGLPSMRADRLTETEKAFVTDAAMAVLAVPVPSPVPERHGPGGP